MLRRHSAWLSVPLALTVVLVAGSCGADRTRADPAESAPAATVPAQSAHADHEAAQKHADHRGSDAPVADRRAAATDRERAAADALFDAARASLARFEHEPDARRAGFFPAPGARRLVHYRNLANRRDDQALDPDRPEGLVYLRTASGGLRLLGAVFTVRGGEAAPTPGGGIFLWHTHDPRCGSFLVAPGSCTETFRMLHIWTVAGVADPWVQPLRVALGRA